MGLAIVCDGFGKFLTLEQSRNINDREVGLVGSTQLDLEDVVRETSSGSCGELFTLDGQAHSLGSLHCCQYQSVTRSRA
jgi:hypothetical protein